MADEKDIVETSTGESLDNVLATIRDRVSAHVQEGSADAAGGGAAGGGGGLVQAVGELHEEVKNLQAHLHESAALSGEALSAERIEEIIIATAKPLLALLLQEWIEKSLPPLAEKLIREEIDRITRPIKNR